ncbi:choice-of-anchor Q domain-containing protein [Nevskia sp.]|uniref:choice-of-anchor Q domain-containing protein n=1 Tax=Nevskia sp. TaxID=1929292 RepID=UPI0026001AC2|nr:choice-of-anchor Q domain-containing protein [Nevskia sp.]
MTTLLRTALAMLACTAVMPAMAATYTVTKTDDTFDGVCNSDCSLREAVQAANLHPGADLIRLPAGRYVLSLGTAGVGDEQDNSVGDLDVGGALDIAGAARDTTIIDGGYRDRVLEILSGASFRATSLTITKGANSSAPNGGGNILNAGTAMLRNTRITADFLISNATRGGGIANQGTMTLENCLIENVNSSSSGGGLFNSGTLFLRRSEVRANGSRSGGGLYNAGSAYIEQSLFSSNSASQYSGGFAIYNVGVLEASSSTISGNFNKIAEDFAFDLVGAVANFGTMNLSFVTITNNIGGGLYNSGTVSLYGSLMSGNLSAHLMREPPDEDEPPYDLDIPPEVSNTDCVNDGSYTSQNTIVSLSNYFCPGQYQIDSNSIGTLIEPLRLGGGVTATHKPRRGSLLVDAIDPSSATDACAAVDQRGARRPPNDDGRRGLRCDIGAYELLQ